MSRDTADLIGERNNTHGDAYTQMSTTGELWGAVLRAYGWTAPPGADGALTAWQADQLLILNKMSRIATGDAAHADHWDDTRGYAVLGLDHAQRDAA